MDRLLAIIKLQPEDSSQKVRAADRLIKHDPFPQKWGVYYLIIDEKQKNIVSHTHLMANIILDINHLSYTIQGIVLQ